MNVPHSQPRENEILELINYLFTPPHTPPQQQTKVPFSQCMHAKSLQSCPTLFDPMDYSQPGSPVHGILQARMVCHALLQGIFPTEGLNPCLLQLLHCRQILYHYSRQRSPPFLHSIPVVDVVVQSLSSVWLWCYGLQHARLPCPSLSSRDCSNSCQLSQWCHSSNMWCLFEARHSDSCAVIPICVFDLHFPDD